ncbi:MAG: hypothetical protein B7Z76_01560 [Acidiphilium sp. 20-67-58]|nr:MAG: hypothetical protein B7Z76_01560 [Acidiphilium sp. 20-67-58]
MLGHKTALSGSLMVFGRLVSRVIDLFTMLILARLLSPADFGLVAIAMTLVTILEAALEMPLSQALVQLPEISPHHLHTAFTLSLLRGATLCLLVSGIAIPFAHWYGHPELIPLIQALSLAPAARGMQTPRLAEYAKALNFVYEFWFELAGKVTAFATAAILAFTTHSFWSIGLCTIAGPVVNTLLGYVVLPYRPRLSLRDWRLFSGFLGWVSVSQILMSFNIQSEQLLLGKLMPASRLGLFSTANNLSNIPLAALFSPILRPLLSAFTVVRDDLARLRESYQLAASAVIAIGLPLLIGQAAVAGPLVQVLLGPKWVSAISMTRWLSISLIPYMFGILLSPLGMSLGRTREIASRNTVQVLVKLPLLVGGALYWGFAGVIAARLISETVTAIFCMASIRQLCGISIRDQLRVSQRSIVASLVMLAAVVGLDSLLHLPGGMMGQLTRLALLVMSGMAVYAGSLMAIWHLLGRPSGIEQSALRFVSDIVGRRRRTVPNRQPV